jgi:hypothetical protein
VLLSGVIVMQTLRILTACAATLIVGSASAQQQSDTQQTPQATQDVGGVTQMSQSDAGASIKTTRQQVYNELIRSENSGEQARLNSSLYHGN